MLGWMGERTVAFDPNKHTPSSSVVLKQRSNFLMSENVALDGGATGGIDPIMQTPPLPHQNFVKRAVFLWE